MKKVLGIICGTVIAVTGLFGIAGTAAWWNAWLFLVLMVLTGILTQWLVKGSPGLAEERRTAASKAKPWDRKLVVFINLALPAMLVVAALDFRFHWFPPVPIAASITAFIVMIPAVRFTFRAMAANPFFSSYVRIQQDRGQVVVSDGPYGLVRHPGYAGAIGFNILVPVAVGSWAALIFGLGSAVLLVYRTAREDRVLMEELKGYTDYARQVQSRLIPGIW